MKKTAIALLLVVIMFSLVACGLIQGAKPDDGDNTGDNIDNVVDNNNGDDTDDIIDDNKDDNKDDNTDNNDKTDVEITFDAGKGAFVDGTSYIKVTAINGNAAIDNEPRLDAHAFVGWYNGDDKFDPSATYTVSQTFTAKYVSGSTDDVYNALFDESAVVAVDINMSDAQWRKLNQDYYDFAFNGGKSPIYRMADSVTIGIDTGDGMLYYYYEEVGVRLKGNTSRHAFYGNNGFFDNVHFKLSFKQTFDDVEDGYKQDELKVWTDSQKRDERKARTLGGMEKIDLKYNSTADETYVRELYAMKLFRDNGIYAPNVTLCSLTALEKDTTNKNLGVYRIHEPIDEVFIQRRLHEDKVGDLWKCTYTAKGPADLTDYDLSNRVGVEDEMAGEFFSYDKKTNKKKDKTTGLRDFTSIINFIQNISQSNADYSQLIDVEYFAKFEAINYVLGNPDCIRNNSNNYYLYFRADGKAIIIPYDYDRCLGITKDWNPTESASMYVTPYTRTTAATGGQQYNPLYVNLIDKGAPYNEGSALLMYRQHLIDLYNSSFVTATTFNTYKDNYKAMYAQYTATALSTNKLSFDDANTGNVPYTTYMQNKLQTLINNIDNYRA
ncbi:MAG: CotH kinase family protein [Clostridia bacterium]|nr:CotH kinase family protein [Clostridia bacterium]